MTNARPEVQPSGFEQQTYRKVARRIIPYLFLCYILAYVDRVNVGFAKLQMQQDLGMSDAVYGLGAGVFFIGYFFFEVAAFMCGQSLFWALPTAMLSGSAAAAGIAWINSVGNLAGYVSPFAIGKIRDATGSMTPALLMLAASMLMSALLVIGAVKPRKN